MAKKFECADVVQNCGWSATADDEGELMQKIQEHAKEHGMTEISGETLEKVKAAIKEE